MNDLKPFKHGEEGTHYVCQEVLELKGGKATCCGCSGHKCKKPKPMKRIKKEVEACCEAQVWEGGDKHTSTCTKPQEKCKHGSDTICIHCGIPSPKPTKIKKLREWDFDMTGLAPEATTAIRILGNKINQIIDLLSH